MLLRNVHVMSSVCKRVCVCVFVGGGVTGERGPRCRRGVQPWACLTGKRARCRWGLGWRAVSCALSFQKRMRAAGAVEMRVLVRVRARVCARARARVHRKFVCARQAAGR